MARNKSKGTVDRVAEGIGHALGSVTGTIESLQAQHPHPMNEAREALVAGQETLTAMASRARTGAADMVKKAKAVAQRTKKAAKGTRAKTAPARARATRAAKKTVKKTVKRAKKAVKRGRQALKRAATRLKR